MNRDDEQRRATERESQTNANEHISQTEQAQREQEQQARLAREAQARQLAERQRQRAARKQPPPLDRRTPTNALIGGDDAVAL